MRKRRLLAWLMAMVMAIGLMPATALADSKINPSDSENYTSTTTVYELDLDDDDASINKHVVPRYVWENNGTTYIAFRHNNTSQPFESAAIEKENGKDHDKWVSTSDFTYTYKLVINGKDYKANEGDFWAVAAFAGNLADFIDDDDEMDISWKPKNGQGFGGKDVDFELKPATPVEPQVPTAPTQLNVGLEIVCTDEAHEHSVETFDYTIGDVEGNDQNGYHVAVTLDNPKAYYPAGHEADDSENDVTELTFDWDGENWVCATTSANFMLYVKPVTDRSHDTEFHTMYMEAIRNKIRDAKNLSDDTTVDVKRVYVHGDKQVQIASTQGWTQWIDRMNEWDHSIPGINGQGNLGQEDWWKTLNTPDPLKSETVDKIEIVARVNGERVVTQVNADHLKNVALSNWDSHITELYLKFDVTFDTNGVEITKPDSQIVEFGNKATDPNTEGVKWYKDADCTAEWDFATDVVRRNTTLYAGVDNPNPPVEETKKIIVTFGPLYDGDSWEDGVEANYPHTFTLWSDTASAECTAPGVVAPEGKEFVKWEGNLGNRSLDDGASFCYNDFKDFVSFDYTDPTDGVPTGYISFYPVYKDAEVPVAKTLKIYWAIDNPAGAEWVTNGNSDAWTETIAWSDKDNTFVMPSLEIKEGYKLNGWSVSGTTGNFWDADTKTFGLTGLIVEDENGGYVSITANIVSDQPGNPDADKTLRIHWAIDNPNGAEWVTYGNSNAWTETIAWSNKDNTFVMPSLEIKEGYKLNGWSVSGTTGNFWDADTKTFGLTGLIVEDENGGYVSITANIVRDQTEETEEITVHFYISNEEAGNYIIGEEKVKNHDVTVGVKDKVTFPELEYDTSKYELTGWQVDGRYSVVWDAEAFEMLVEGLDNNGHISVTPLFKLKNTSSEDKADLDIEKELVEVNGKEWNGKKVSKGDELTYYITVDNFDGKKDASFITVIDKATNLKNGEFIGIIEDGDLVKFNKNDEIKTEDDIVITKVNDDEVMIDELPKGTSVVLVYEGTVSSSSKDVTNVAIAEDKEGKELDRSEKVETGVKDSSGAISSKNRSTKPSKVEEVLNTEDHFQYVQGYPDNTVGPERNITRAEATVIFFRLLNDSVRTKYLDADNAFADVNLDDWFNLGVSTMENGGFVSGYDDGLFRPNAYITRAELATIISNFDDLEPAAENKFADVEGHWAEKYINSAAEKGWLSGYEDGLFRPNQYITRAETMSMINRVLDRRVDADGLHAAAKQWKDNPESKWYYYAVLEATNYHEYERADVSDYENWTAIKAEKIWEN